MRAEIQIPTVQFGLIKVFFEGDRQEIIDEHNALYNAYHGGFGLETGAFNKALDRYLTDGTGETEVFMQMSKEQQSVFQEIKKSIKRIKYESAKELRGTGEVVGQEGNKKRGRRKTKVRSNGGTIPTGGDTASGTPPSEGTSGTS